MEDQSSFNIRKIDLTTISRRLLDSRLLPLLILATIVAILAASASGYFYFQYTKAQKQLKTKAQTQAIKETVNETKKLIEEVGKLINLPKDEEPTIATVTDVDKLKDQPFFKEAKVGDKVLIYPKAQKSILYDPKNKRIVEAGFFTTVLSEKELMITVRNGTSTEGLASKAEEEIRKAYPDAKVESSWATQRDKYNKTLVVILDDQATDQAIKLAKIFNAQIGDLPKGEERPKNKKILIILGKDSI